MPIPGTPVMIIDANVLGELLRGKCCTDPSSLTSDERKTLEVYASSADLYTSSLARLCLKAASDEKYRMALRVACAAIDIAEAPGNVAVVRAEDAVETLAYYYCMDVTRGDMPFELYTLLATLVPRQRLFPWLNVRREMCLRVLATLGDSRLEDIACSIVKGHQGIASLNISAKYVCHMYSLLKKLLTTVMPPDKVKQVLLEMKKSLDEISESASNLASLDERIVAKCFGNLHPPVKTAEKLAILARDAARELESAIEELASIASHTDPSYAVFVDEELPWKLRKVNEMCVLLDLLL